ncbi:MAG: 30S ribosomal protein S8 [Deltaproteobacteria bacterium]|jgi:small subunit ribosomal protein S8|nr:30S ribosomal protein S8 [Deltaproteobacteria bacterium]
MSLTDPIAELATRLRNAQKAGYRQVEVPHSRLKEALCRVLAEQRFLAAVETKGEGPNKALVLGLRYLSNHQGAIRSIRRVSRPALRRYSTSAKMPRVSAGIGCYVVSTPQGVMTDREARRRRVGGELLVEVS